MELYTGTDQGDEDHISHEKSTASSIVTTSTALKTDESSPIETTSATHGNVTSQS